MDEKKLIQACCRGEIKAQKIVYEKFGPKLMGICLRYAGNREDAEEIFHDTFIKIFNNINKFKHESSFQTWISRIGINTALDFLRKRKKTLFLGYISEHINEVEDYDIPKEISIEAETAMQLMKTLPMNQQVIINLFIIEDMSHREIAQELGISEEASRVQLSRAKKALVEVFNSKKSKNEYR